MSRISSRPRRLSRGQQQLQTREQLLRSAGEILSNEGAEQVSVEEVAEAAGYSKGAFYSNFESKEELFVELLDRQVSLQLSEMDRAFDAEGPTAGHAPTAAESLIRAISSNLDSEQILFELTIYARRNERFRAKLVNCHRVLRERFAALLNSRLRSGDGKGSDLGADKVALMLVAIGIGIGRVKELEPEAISEPLYEWTLAIFLRGVEALSNDEQQRPRQAPGRT